MSIVDHEPSFLNILIIFSIFRSEYHVLPKTDSFSLYNFSPVIEVILKYSKDARIDLEARDKEGRTPLHYLYWYKAKDDVESFLKAAKEEYDIEFDLNAKDDNGLTPSQMSGRPGKLAALAFAYFAH